MIENHLAKIIKNHPQKTNQFYYPSHLSWRNLNIFCNILTYKIIFPLLRLKVAPLLLQCCSEQPIVHTSALWVAPVVLLGAVGAGGGGP